MKKLVKGIIDFRKSLTPDYMKTFSKLALGQSPDTLFIACSDSRVAPNVFASTDPGDLFVIRNVGNIVPPCGGQHGLSSADESEAAAIEFAVKNLNVRDIIICGHSECGAMHALYSGRDKIATPNLKAWLCHGDISLEALRQEKNRETPLTPQNRLSQINVLKQIENLMSYPLVQARIASRDLRVHGWWFELAKVSVHSYSPEKKVFEVIDEAKAQEILKLLDP